MEIMIVLLTSFLSLTFSPVLPSAPLSLESQEAPIASALEELGEDVRIFNDHIVTLSSPFMEGRLPGTRGMEVARDYIEFYLKEAGMEPAFQDENGEPSFRQPFPLGSSRKIRAQKFSVAGVALPFREDEDYVMTQIGDSGDVSGQPVFVGYGIEKGKDNYNNFAAETDLEGKIAVLFRFEPVNAQGESKWTTGSRSRWTRAGGFTAKMESLKKRNVAGVIILNPPGVDDPRTDRLMSKAQGTQRIQVPVVMLSQDAGDRLCRALDPQGRSALQLRELADLGNQPIPWKGNAKLRAEISSADLYAENVGGILRGKGDLKDEWIVTGGHIDHLGMGEFGSRSRSAGELHPGADDNASGTAGILMLADKLRAEYEKMPADADARSILFIGLDAEESGLNGSRFYVRNPIASLDRHVLMINFDMIGRISDKRLQILGTQTAEEFDEWLDPLFEASPLTIVKTKEMNLGSDHIPFMQKNIPVLFGIIADFHDDYHTPRDTSSKINRVDAVHTIHLFHQILLKGATRNSPFVFTKP